MFTCYKKLFESKSEQNRIVQDYVKELPIKQFRFFKRGDFFSPSMKFFSDVDLLFIHRNGSTFSMDVDRMLWSLKDIEIINMTEFELFVDDQNLDTFGKPINEFDRNDITSDIAKVSFYGFINLGKYVFPLEIVMIRHGTKSQISDFTAIIDTAVAQENFPLALKRYYALLGRLRFGSGANGLGTYKPSHGNLDDAREELKRYLNKLLFWKSVNVQLRMVYPYLENKDGKKSAQKYLKDLMIDKPGEPECDAFRFITVPRELTMKDLESLDTTLIYDRIEAYLRAMSRAYYFKHIVKEFEDIKTWMMEQASD